MSNFLKRRDRLRKVIRVEQAESLLVTNPVNVTYLTGFTGGDSYLLVTQNTDLLLSDPRYEEQIGEESPGLATFIRQPGELLGEVTIHELNKLGLKSLAVEGDHLTVNTFDVWQRELKVESLVKASGWVEGLRAIKDKEELVAIRRAVDIAERVFTSVRAQLSARQSERDVANEIERLTRAMGGSACAFKPIVAVGARAALPHATPGESAIGSSPFVLIDWGAIVDGYRSDLTRVLATGKIPSKFAKVYETVLAAQSAAIEALKPGVLTSQIDQIARDVIASAGMGPRFNHGLGHGIGLDIHEAPRMSKKLDQPLVAGMVVTVEPGIYYTGWGGVRIEDDVLITASGYELLSSLPRSLAENTARLLFS